MLTSMITVGSQTNALKAQRQLAKHNINSEIVKAVADKKRGCIFAVRVASAEYLSALSRLTELGFKLD